MERYLQHWSRYKNAFPAGAPPTQQQLAFYLVVPNMRTNFITSQNPPVGEGANNTNAELVSNKQRRCKRSQLLSEFRR